MKPVSLIAAAVIGASVILAAVAFALVSELLRSAEDTGTAEIVARLERQVAEQTRDLRLLRGEVEALKGELEALRAEAAPGRQGAAPAAAPGAAAALPEIGAFGLDQFGGSAPPPETEGLIDAMTIHTGQFNQGVGRARPALLRELLGDPRDSYTQECLPVTNPRLVAALETRQIAGFRVTMLQPALDSLERIIRRLRDEEPEIYAALGTAGALCARYVRGSGASVSNHAWGAAVDLTLKGELDGFGDGTTQFGLVVLAEFFNDEGWFWGATFGREDSMHFEVGEELLRQWVADGML